MFPLAPLLALLAAADALSGVGGEWTANGAHLRLSEEQGAVVGRLSEVTGPCALPSGTEVLRGTLLDDSLSAQVRVCLLSPSCGSSADTALAVLLVTQTLTGGVHCKNGCARDVRALVLRRPDNRAATPKQEPEAPPAKVEKVKGLLERGAQLLQQGKIDEARKPFLEATELDPGRAEAFNGVGVTHYARHELQDAVAWYKRALAANPGFGDAYYNIACAYSLQGKPALAFRYLRLAALNGYSARQELETDPDLAALREDPEWSQLLGQIR